MVRAVGHISGRDFLSYHGSCSSWSSALNSGSNSESVMPNHPVLGSSDRSISSISLSSDQCMLQTQVNYRSMVDKESQAGWKECLWGAGFFDHIEIIRISTFPMPSVFIYLMSRLYAFQKTNRAIFYIWSEHIFILLFYMSVILPTLLLVFTIGDQCMCPRWIWQLIFSTFLLIFIFCVFHGIIFFLKPMSHSMLKFQFLTLTRCSYHH